MPSPQRNGIPLRHVARTVCDALDGTNAPPGAMAALADLIPDQSTAGVFVPRPAAVKIADLLALQSAGIISGLLVVGDIAYGMAATAKFVGKDEPFALNLATGILYPVAGVTFANTPISPPASGEWTPPILSQIGTSIVVCHPGFFGGATKFGWFDIGSANLAISGTLTLGSPVVSGSPAVLGVMPGMLASGPGVTPGTTVVATAGGGTPTITLSSNATAAGTGVALTIQGGTPTNPLWGAGDTDRHPLPSVPLGVAQMNGRAYFACGPNGVVFSDSLQPRLVSNSSQVQALTTNDGLSCTAIGPLMLSAPLTGGIVQGLIVFEGATKMQQIVGDQATSNLTINALPMATGTLAPLTIMPCRRGLGFVSPEGLRFIGFDGSVSEPVGEPETGEAGVTLPFVLSAYPSRMCAAANQDVFRITTQNGTAPGAPAQEYWYDLSRRCWTGPHSFPAALVQPWRHSFVLAPAHVTASLWQSDPHPSLTSVYVENGTALSWTYATSLLPDGGEIVEYALVDMTLAMATVPEAATEWDGGALWDNAAWDGAGALVTAVDQTGAQLDQTIVSPSIAPTVWGHFTWGNAVWGGANSAYQQRLVSWNLPLVFKQLQIIVAGASAAGVKIGNLYMRYESLGYPLMEAS